MFGSGDAALRSGILAMNDANELGCSNLRLCSPATAVNEGLEVQMCLSTKVLVRSNPARLNRKRTKMQS